MQPVHLFELASRQAEWLAVRQSTVAGNIANANTPGFKAQDVAPFSDVLDRTRLAMAATNPTHLTSGGAERGAFDAVESDSWAVLPSGNSVSLEQELMKAGEVSRDHALNASVVKAFHRMLMSAVRI